MLRRVAVPFLVATTTLVAPAVFAASIVPPENLGELALRSRAVVLARAGEATPFWRGQLLMTRTSFTVIEVLSGEAGSTSTLTVETPGGEMDGIGWAVAGSPKFKPGQVYLLFLDRKASGEWQPAMLSYGLLERVIGRDGSHLLAPVEEATGMEPFPRADGILPEQVETYREITLLPHLVAVIHGDAAWDSRKVVAERAQVPLRLSALAPPSGCTYITGGAPYARWPYNTGSSPGQVSVSAENDGDNSLAGGGFTQVQGAVGMWMGIANTSWNFVYGGQMNYDLSCTSDPHDAPAAGTNIVIFNDPCSDIAPLSGCSGTLAFGGPWYGGTHTFDGTSWYSIASLFVVVNDGSGCMGATNYQRMLAHEMGHGLGFGHYEDSSALMYFMCCNPINPTDTSCAQYTYPGGSSTPTPTIPPGTATPTPPVTIPAAPTGVTASDGTFADRVAISWNAVSGASFYRVYRNLTSSTSGATQLGIAYATQFNDSTAAVGTTYWYWVQAENTNGLSGLGGPDTGYRATGPTATPTPPGPTATPTQPPVPTFTPTPAVTPTPTPVLPSNVAVVAHNTGAAGTAWRSDVTLANPSDAALPVDLRYKASGGAVTARSLSLAARETRLLGDVLVSFFGLGDGRGALQIVPPTRGPAPAVASRTYNQTAAGNLGFGTMSLVPPVAGTYYISGLYADTVARTNLAVTAGATGTNASVILYRGSAGQVSQTSLWVGANDQQQWAVQDLFPGTAQTGVPMSVSMQLDGAAQVYATQVDQASGDTVFLSGSPAASSWLIPVVAHNSGAGGTYWRSDLYLFNASGMLAAVTLDYLPEGRDNSAGGTASTSVTLGPFATMTIPDLVGTRFGVTQGKGSLAITSSMPVIAASRCYTTRSLGGTLGFGAPALRPIALHTATRTLPGVRVLDGYRTNIGLFTGTLGANVTLRLRNANGALLATNSTLWVPPRTLVQLSLADAFPGAASPNPVGAVEVQTNAPLGAYLSVVDGSSQDPILVLAP